MTALDGEVLGEVQFVAPLAVARELAHLAHLVHDLEVLATVDDVALLAELVVADGIVDSIHVDDSMGEHALVDAGGHLLRVGDKGQQQDGEGEGDLFHDEYGLNS